MSDLAAADGAAATPDELCAALVAPADLERIRLLAALADGPREPKVLRDLLGCTPPELGVHLSQLGRAGLIRTTKDGRDTRISLNRDRLEVLRRPAASAPATPAPTFPGATPAEERVLATFFHSERLRSVPAQRTKLLVVLRFLVQRFEPDRDYPELEVNALLRPAHDDVAALRRDLVDFGFLTRSAGIYRRLPESSGAE